MQGSEEFPEKNLLKRFCMNGQAAVVGFQRGISRKDKKIKHLQTLTQRARVAGGPFISMLTCYSAGWRGMLLMSKMKLIIFKFFLLAHPLHWCQRTQIEPEPKKLSM